MKFTDVIIAVLCAFFFFNFLYFPPTLILGIIGIIGLLVAYPGTVASNKDEEITKATDAEPGEIKTGGFLTYLFGALGMTAVFGAFVMGMLILMMFGLGVIVVPGF